MTQHEKEAAKLIRQGYRATSNRYKTVSRLDRADWRGHMAERHAPWSKEEGERWVNALGAYASEFYMRVYSRDRLELNSTLFALVKKAGRYAEYCEKC